MRRADLEHLIRAAATIANESELIIIGSQSILGQYPDAPPDLRMSMEADLYPKNRPELAELIDGCIGEGSPFHATFGYYAQGVGPGTATLPRGWERRLIRVDTASTQPGTGLCLEAHDLALSKYTAGREKDLEFTRRMVEARMLDKDILLKRVPTMDLDPATGRLMLGRIKRHFS
ncbi:MAG: DUF6036 family nucleotidyltransferase [Betaproteobacteria bacterium]